MRGIDVSLITPTCRERENIVPLVAEMSPATNGHHWDALFIDDGTDTEIARLSEAAPRRRLLCGVENRSGLAGIAVFTSLNWSVR